MNADLFCLYLPINFINTTIMRKVQLLFVCLMLSAAAFAADKVVKLPKPNLNRTGTVMKALSERQSTREYASKALTLADLSDLLWAANGINRSDAGKRTR